MWPLKEMELVNLHLHAPTQQEYSACASFLIICIPFHCLPSNATCKTRVLLERLLYCNLCNTSCFRLFSGYYQFQEFQVANIPVLGNSWGRKKEKYIFTRSDINYENNTVPQGGDGGRKVSWCADYCPIARGCCLRYRKNVSTSGSQRHNMRDAILERVTFPI